MQPSMNIDMIDHTPSDSTDAGDNTSRRDLLFTVQFVAGQLRQLQKGWSRIDQSIDTVPCDKFTYANFSTLFHEAGLYWKFRSTSGRVSLNSLLSATLHHFIDPASQFVHQCLHSIWIVL